MPLFPSRVFPASHPEANIEGFHRLIDRMHERGRPVLSWYSLNHSESVATAHPDWRMVPFSDDQAIDDDHTFCCVNSPYGDMLAKFVAEVVRDVRFDGIWFDGNCFALHNRAAACRCAYCRDRFQRDTGQVLPGKVDFDDEAFRTWVQWRYEVWVGTWKKLHAAITEANPDAIMAINNYRRYPVPGWMRGIPMRKLAMNILMSGELDLHVFHGDFQMKMHQAYECGLGQDSWLALCDHWNMWVPDIETLPVEQAAVSCASAGGALWMGSGVDHRLSPDACIAAQKATAPLLPYTGGAFVEHVMIWVSQCTQDFHYDAREDYKGAWDAWHGVNELCLHAHVQSTVVFDDHVTDGDIVGRAPVLYAGSAACVSDEQATHLRDFVAKGGVLIASHDAGTRDEWGRPRDTPLLDDLLGITARTPGEASPTLELTDAHLVDACGRWVSAHGAPHTLATPGSDVDLLAHVVDHPMEAWDRFEGRPEPKPRHPGLWFRRHGDGGVIYLGLDLARGHITAPTTFQVRLFKALLERLAPPAITLDAPLQVTMNVREQSDGRWAVLLHNAPGTIWRYPTYHNSGELLPIFDLRIRLTRRTVVEATAVLSGESYAVADDGRSIVVPTLHRNEVVLLRFAPGA